MTQFGDQLYQFGGMPVDLPYSFLKGPQGKVLFVAPYRTAVGDNNGTNANDSNPGTLDRPMKTILAAYNLMSGNLGEIIYLLGYQNAAASVTDDWSATLTWAKNAVHLIGLVPPMEVSHRVRIGAASAAAALSPLLDVTGHNNVFANFQLFHGQAEATALINLRVTGQRNLFDRVHVAGIGNATQSAAGAADLSLTGSENVFKKCVIGLDTITRDADATNLLVDGGASRNYFEDCLFQAFISAAGYFGVTINDATAFDRWLRFVRCRFMTESVNDVTQQTSVFSIPAMTQGYIMLEDCYAGTAGGAAEWDSNNRGRIYNNAVASAVSAAGGIFTRQ